MITASGRPPENRVGPALADRPFGHSSYGALSRGEQQPGATPRYAAVARAAALLAGLSHVDDDGATVRLLLFGGLSAHDSRCCAGGRAASRSCSRSAQ